MNQKLIVAGLAALGALCSLSPAKAEPAPTASHASVAALFGYGFKDGANLGLGVRGGYTLPMNLYLGGTFLYHLGKSESAGGIETSANIYYFGVEGGYDIGAGPVVIRPYLGLGGVGAKGKTSVCLMGQCASSDFSDTKFGVWPGATLLYPLGSAFVGVDTRFLIVEDYNTFSLFATGGIQF